MSKPIIYIASGWFNKEQKRQMDEVYEVLCELKKENKIEFFSPFYDGVVLLKTDPDLRRKMKEVWELDISKIESSDLLVVCTQDHDVGTIFEAGYASSWGRSTGSSVTLLCYNSLPELGLNLMLAQEAKGFVKSPAQLKEAIENYVGAFELGVQINWVYNLWEGIPI